MKGRRFLPWLAGIGAFMFVAALRSHGWLESAELAIYDLGVRLRTPVPDARVVLILEREEDLRRYGYPMSDARMTELLDVLMRAGAAAVGIDKYRDMHVPPGSERLTATVARLDNLVWVFKFAAGGETGIGPPGFAADPEQVGFNDLVIDGDGQVRRVPLFLDDGTRSAQSLAFSLAAKYLQAHGIAPQADPDRPEAMLLGKLRLSPLEASDGGYAVADAGGFQMLVDYRAGTGGFPSYSLDDAMQGRIPPGALKDKIVIYGSVAESFKDFFDTPMQRFGAGAHGTFGVEIHAHVVSQLVRQALGEEVAVRWWSDGAELGVLLLCSLLGATVGYALRRPVVLGMAMGGGAVLIASAAAAAVAAGWWLALVPSVFGYLLSAVISVVWRAFAEFEERRTVMRLFSRYVSKEVADEIWAQRGQFLADGKPKPTLLTATVLFSDVAGFTSVSEAMAPETLFSWLDDYMAAMTQAIIEHHGVINKYIGDAVMALYGVPVARSLAEEIARDACAAVESALAMGRALERINADSAAKGLPRIRMRVGICTGPLAAGTIGRGDRLEFTVLGDTVNVASRLESLKTVESDSPCRILVCAETYRHVGYRFRGREVGEVALKGKNCQVAVFEILGGADGGA